MLEQKVLPAGIASFLAKFAARSRLWPLAPRLADNLADRLSDLTPGTGGNETLRRWTSVSLFE